MFNVCEDISVENTPGSGQYGHGDACVTTEGTGVTGDTMTGAAPAFQVSRKDDFCWRLGDSHENAVWSLLEPEDPSRGVALTYTGGNACNSMDYRRTLKIAFECVNDIANIPDQEVVEEVSTCRYEIIVPSIYGCPTECGVKDRHLCNNKGVCRYDKTNKASKCFCVTGWEGSDCGTETASKSASSDGATVGVLVFVCILLVVLIVGLAVMWVKIRGLRLDPAAYATLSGGGNNAADKEVL